MKLHKKQIEAVKKCVKWYYLESFHKPYFIIAGYAGSGKSTIINYIIRYLDISHSNVIFVTYIAKASLRLRTMGVNSNTIHSTFYRVVDEGNGKVKFYKRKTLGMDVKLIVVDEAACVPDNMIRDILSFNVPTLLTGDIGQLKPPMSKQSTYMRLENCDIFLDKVFRSDDKSGILDLASKARNREKISYGRYGNSEVVHFRTLRNSLSNYEILLCYKNSTRRSLNRLVRDRLGYSNKSLYPLKGEKIVCLKNNYNFSIKYKDIDVYIVNGLIGIVLEDSKIDRDGFLNIKFVPDFMYNDNVYGYFNVRTYKEYYEKCYNDSIIEPPLYRNSIDARKNESGLESDSEKIIYSTYGYCITTYKSQGSEFNNCMVLADDVPQYAEYYPNFLYTAITRAKEFVTVATMK